MPTLKIDQLKKWSSALPEGWKFDAQHYVMWGEKEIFTDSRENENGVFYRLTLEYRAETENAGYFRKETGRQIPTVSVSRYTPTGSGNMFSVVHILTEAAAEPESKRNYNILVKLAAALDVNNYFKRAAEKDTGKQYNDFSDFAGIITDAAEDNDSAEQEAAEETETAEQAENTTEEENAAEAQENAENMPPYKCAEDMKAAFIADGWSADIDVREATAEEIEKSGHYIKSAAANGRKFYIMAGSGNMYDDHGKIVYYNIPTAPERCRKAYFAGEMTLEQIADELHSAGMIPYVDANAAADYLGLEHEEESTEDAQTVEEAAEEAAEDMTKEAAPDMFSQLAAAYFSGKAVKSKPRKIEQEPPKVEEAAEPETVEPEQEPEPIAPGYNENQNHRFTEEERKALSEGLNVWKSGDYSQNYCFFSATYSEGVRLVYSSYAWKDSKQRLQPDKNPEYSGFLVGTDFYSNPTAIRAKFNDDINRFIVEHIASEEAAARNVEENAEAVHGYEQSQIKDSLSADYTREAQDLFYKREKPELVLYSGENHDTAVLIDYILEPERMIEQAANEYMKYRAAGIYRAYIRYNRISAALSAIESDAENKCHVLRRISETVDDQKTVKILLASGYTVKCEARGVKNITNYGTISDYYVLACDRQYLRQNQYRHYEDIDYTEIKQITHGAKVLYSA